MAEESVVSPLETAKGSVEELFSFRDHYLEKFDIERAKHKNEDVSEQLQKCLTKLEELKDHLDKSIYLSLRGKALNVLPAYSSEAQELLSRAVKLDPKLVEAWIQLGEVYWKNKDVQGAKNCFLGALNHSQDKVALRNLSMVLRQLGDTAEERAQLVTESVEKAKASVQLDIKDGTSWFIMGNAYLSLFFTSGQSPATLQQCSRAYQQAMYKYQEEYLSALEDLTLAAALDPTWTEPPEMEKQLISYLDRISELVANKGKQKGKKLSSLCASITDSDLGPYGGGTYTSPSGGKVRLQPALFAKLHPQINKETVVVGKVVCSLTTDDVVPFTFCLVDRDSTCYSVTLYNIAPGYGVKIGDSVAVPEPYLQTVNFTYKDKSYDFKNIRVDSPVILVVNGRKQDRSTQAPSVLAISTMSE